MAKHLETGKKGEQIAKGYLEKIGFRILEMNWRYKKLEVDIIAKEGEVLVFVEVKTRSTVFFGKPEIFVSPNKEANLSEACGAYMNQIQHDWAIRFDVVSVLLEKDKEASITHIKDAFFPKLG